MRGRKEVNMQEREGREELGRVEGGETIIRIYYIRKSSILIKVFYHIYVNFIL